MAVIIKVTTLLQLQGNKNNQLRFIPSPLINNRPTLGELRKDFIMVFCFLCAGVSFEQLQV
jgi:hypothetical protein|tara:strand:- start:2841 stop:3023 length:183 start_codon:yes stop_codon:yes gene_type:complete